MTRSEAACETAMLVGMIEMETRLTWSEIVSYPSPIGVHVRSGHMARLIVERMLRGTVHGWRTVRRDVPASRAVSATAVAALCA